MTTGKLFDVSSYEEDKIKTCRPGRSSQIDNQQRETQGPVLS